VPFCPLSCHGWRLLLCTTCCRPAAGTSCGAREGVRYLHIPEPGV
jgi:hypothetical protein